MTGILFLCIHNAGRSQMAAGFAREFGGDRITILSGGSDPADAVNPNAVEVMAEVDIDISRFIPLKYNDNLLSSVDIVVTMGCGDTCPYVPGKKYMDWPIDDPAGRPVEEVRRIRDEIRNCVADLLGQL